MTDDVSRVNIGDRAVAVSRSLGEIDYDDLSRELAEANGTAIWWGVLAARAQAHAQRATAVFEVVKATVARQTRATGAKAAIKTTEKGIEEVITLHPDVQAAQEAMIVAEEGAAIVRAAQRGIDRKAATLENLSRSVGQDINNRRPPETREPLVPRERRPLPPPVTRTPVR